MFVVFNVLQRGKLLSHTNLGVNRNNFDWWAQRFACVSTEAMSSLTASGMLVVISDFRKPQQTPRNRLQLSQVLVGRRRESKDLTQMSYIQGRHSTKVLTVIDNGDFCSLYKLNRVGRHQVSLVYKWDENIKFSENTSAPGSVAGRPCNRQNRGVIVQANTVYNCHKRQLQGQGPR